MIRRPVARAAGVHDPPAPSGRPRARARGGRGGRRRSARRAGRGRRTASRRLARRGSRAADCADRAAPGARACLRDAARAVVDRQRGGEAALRPVARRTAASGVRRDQRDAAAVARRRTAPCTARRRRRRRPRPRLRSWSAAPCGRYGTRDGVARSTWRIPRSLRARHRRAIPSGPARIARDRARAGGARLARVRAASSRRAVDARGADGGPSRGLRRRDRAAVRGAGGGQLDADTVVSAGSFEAALHAAGGAVAAGRRAARRRGADARSARSVPGPPRDAGAGDGLLPVQQRRGRGAATRSTRAALERVLILDWDVHHGNGTNDIFHALRRGAVRLDPRVAAVSGDRPGGRRRGAATGAATRSTCRSPPAPATTCSARWSTRGRAAGARVRAAAGADLGRLRRAPRRPAGDVRR